MSNILHYRKLSLFNVLQSMSYKNNSVNSRKSYVFSNKEVKRILNHFVMPKITTVLPLSPEHKQNGLVTRKEIFIITKIFIDQIRRINFVCLNFSGSEIPVKFCSKIIKLALRCNTFLLRDNNSRQLIHSPQFFNFIRYESEYLVNTESITSTFPSDYPILGTCYIIYGPICSKMHNNVHKKSDFLYTFQGTNDFPRERSNEKVNKHFSEQKYFVLFTLQPYSQFVDRLRSYNSTVKSSNRNKSGNDYNYNLDVFHNLETYTAIIRFSIIRKLLNGHTVVQIISLELFIGNGTLHYPRNGKYYNSEIHTPTESEILNNISSDLSFEDEF